MVARSRPLRRATRSRNAGSKAISPRIARSVIAATWARLPISAASSSIHSWPIMVESISASKSFLRRPCALCTTTSPAALSRAERTLSATALAPAAGPGSKAMSAAIQGSSHRGTADHLKASLARRSISLVKTGNAGSQTSVATCVMGRLGLTHFVGALPRAGDCPGGGINWRYFIPRQPRLVCVHLPARRSYQNVSRKDFATIAPIIYSPVRSGKARAKTLDFRAGVFEHRSRRRIGNPEIRTKPEGRALHHGNAFGFEERGDEILVIADRFAIRSLLADRASAGWIDIKRAFRRGTVQIFGLVEHGDDEVAPRLENFCTLGYKILRPRQRLDGGPLRDRTGARGLLALKRVHRLDQMLRPRGIADPPSGHRIGFRYAIHGERAAGQLRFHLRRRHEVKIAIGEMLVNVVGQDPHLWMAQQHIGERVQLRTCVGGTRRVRRRI